MTKPAMVVQKKDNDGLKKYRVLNKRRRGGINRMKI
jgi:hypothetical protein